MTQLHRYRKAITTLIGTGLSVWLSRYNPHIWLIVSSWLGTVLGTAAMPNRLSTTDIRWQPNFLRTIQPYLSNNPPTGNVKPYGYSIAGTPAAVPRAGQDYGENVRRACTVFDPTPASECTNAACPVHHPQADADNP